MIFECSFFIFFLHLLFMLTRWAIKSSNLFFFFFLIQFNVSFKIISLISRQTKMGVPPENHLTHPQAELDLSHMWPLWGSNPHQPQQWDDRMIKDNNEISHLNHSATGKSRNLDKILNICNGKDLPKNISARYYQKNKSFFFIFSHLRSVETTGKVP